MPTTLTTTEHTLEAMWHSAALRPEQRQSYMAGAQDVLVLLQRGATADDLQREISLWARTYIGRTT